MKRFLVLILATVMAFSTVSFASAASFNDIANSDKKEIIEELADYGLVEGYGNDEFGPKNTLTRAEACAIIVRAMVDEKNIDMSSINIFSDVAPNTWYRKYVDTAYKYHFVAGYGDKTFGPNDNVTYAQFATMVVNMLGLPATRLTGNWPDNIMFVADKWGLLKNVKYHDINAPIYREDVAQMIYNALDCEMIKIENGKVVNTNMTLAESLGIGFVAVDSTMVKWEKMNGEIYFVLEDSAYVCDPAHFDTTIDSGDRVKVYFNNVGEVVRVKFVAKGNEFTAGGKLTSFTYDENGNFVMLEVDGREYEVSKTASIEGMKIGYEISGAYCEYVVTNGIITHVTFFPDTVIEIIPVEPIPSEE